MASRQTQAGASIYVATKASVDAITRVLAKELGPRKIRVNAINPGGVETEGTHAAGLIGGDFEAKMVQQTPLGRFGQPGDIAPVVVFFASDDSRWVTGETLVVSGGCRHLDESRGSKVATFTRNMIIPAERATCSRTTSTTE